jgi:hypothetical protein
MISGDGIRAGETGKAWTANENIETTALQAKIDAIFDIDVFSLSFGRIALPFDGRDFAYL